MYSLVLTIHEAGYWKPFYYFPESGAIANVLAFPFLRDSGLFSEHTLSLQELSLATTHRAVQKRAG